LSQDDLLLAQVVRARCSFFAQIYEILCQVTIRMCTLQAAASRAFPGENFDPLVYQLFSDEALTQLGGYKLHPLVMYLTLPLAKMRKASNVLIIAYLPVVGIETGITSTPRCPTTAFCRCAAYSLLSIHHSQGCWNTYPAWFDMGCDSRVCDPQAGVQLTSFSMVFKGRIPKLSLQ
jgi:hypothetical protein